MLSRLSVLALSVLALLLGIAGPSAAADDPPKPATSDEAMLTWGTSPTDNAVGKARPNFSYDAHPGGTLRDSIDVVNRSTRPIELNIYASDAFTSSSGVLDLLPAGQRSVDVGAWITLDRATITVPADETVAVPFTLTVPDNATPGDHTGGIVTSLVTENGDGPVAVDRRIGSRVQIRVAGELRPALSVTDVEISYDGSLNPAASGTVHVTYRVTNTGNVRLAARQTVRAGGPFGLLGQSTTAPDLPELLPGNSLTQSVDVAGVWPTVRIGADVTLDPYVTSGELSVAPTSAVADTSLWVMPWGQLAVLVLLAALVWLLLWQRNRRRAAVEAAVAAAVAAAVEKSTAGQP